MIAFPLHNAALDLKNLSPEELPHGKLPVPPEVRELVETQRAVLRPEAFEANREKILNLWTIGWYFDGLCQEVLYRETPDGPVVLAVGADEVQRVRGTATVVDGEPRLKVYLGY